MSEKEMKPVFENSMPWCSRHQCPCFYSYGESGWGVVTGCYCWIGSEMGFVHGNFSLFESQKTLCFPWIKENKPMLYGNIRIDKQGQRVT